VPLRLPLVEPLTLAVAAPTGSRRSPILAGACGAGIVALLAWARLAALDLDPGLLLSAQAAATAALLALGAVGWAACSQQGVSARLGLGRGRGGVGVVLLLAVGLLALSFSLDQLIDLLDLRATSHLAQYDAAVVAAPGRSWPWMLLGLALAPGIGEELFFRGLLQRGLGPWLGRAGALVSSAALFGLFHGEAVHAAGAFGLGLYLGAIAEVSGGIRAPMACHVLNNLAAIGGVGLAPRERWPLAALAACGIVWAALALYLASRLVRRTS
jgi:membrane protease YdiL (CAAX protease family)